MKTIGILLGLLLISIAGCRSEHVTRSSTVLPATLEDATRVVVDGMTDADKKLVRETPSDDLVQFHMGWGMAIRNSVGLWGGNEPLLRSCGKEHPDDASMVIIQNVWRTLRRQYMPTLPTNSPAYTVLHDTRIEELTLLSNSIPQVVSILSKARPQTGLLPKMDIALSPQLATKLQHPLISMVATNISLLDALKAVTEITQTDWYVKEDKILIW